MSYPLDTKVKEANVADANDLPPALQPSERHPRSVGRRIRRIIFSLLAGAFVLFHTFKAYEHFDHERHDWKVVRHAAKGFYQISEAFGEDPVPPHHHRKRPHPECIAWTEPSATPTTFSFNVSSASDVIKLVSRGSFVGSVNFVQADVEASQEYIGVDVDLSWSKPDDGSETGPQKRSILAWWGRRKAHVKAPKARVCAFKTESGEVIGVGLFARPHGKHHHGFSKHRKHHHPHHPHHPHGPPQGHPHWPFPHPPSEPEDPDAPRAPPHLPHVPHRPPPRHTVVVEEGHHMKCHHMWHDHIAFPSSKLAYEQLITAHVTITIPRGPLALQSFSSAFSGLSLSAPSPVFDDVTFESISIVSEHGELDISNLKATKASIVTDEKPITGTFTVTEKLSLITSNASIDANVTLINDGILGHATILNIITKNAPIATVTNLIRASSSLSGIWGETNGSFRVSAISSSAPVVITIASQPISSALSLTAITNRDDVNVTLPPAYEGKFTLVTSKGGESTVIEDDDAQDPEGRGRKRVVDIKTLFGGIATGSVAWDNADPDEALVEEQIEWEAGLLETFPPPEEVAWDLPAHVELITKQGGNNKLLLA